MVVSLTQPIITASDPELIVAVHQLNKRYQTGTEALRGINLNIKRGDLFGLIGPDGAGKSTALSILAGVMEATSGEALIFGKSPSDARHMIGYVPQNCSLYPDLTVEENLHYQAGLYGVSDRLFVQLRDSNLKNMGLLRFADRLAGQLSGGMKQKLALCCALVSQPQLVLLDEPTTGLDPIARRELWQALAGLAHQGVTAVIATPFLDEAERCNRVALMYDGKIDRTGTPEELRQALCMRRLEVTLVGERDKAEIWDIVKSAIFKDINDIYLYGDHLEILAQDTEAAELELRSLLSTIKVEIQDVYETAPNMENVFVMRLRELGLKESRPVPFPRLRKIVSADSTLGPGDIAIEAAASASRQGDIAARAQDSTAQGAIAIGAQNLSKNFKNFRAVENVELAIRYGEIYGLLGANGAGKTTTIKMLCGLMEPTAGIISLAGQNKDLRSRNIRKRIGYMSQKFTLYDGLTVEENLQFYASIYEIPFELRKQQIGWVTQVCDLGNILKSVVGKLPLGWKQRIAFGAAVMHDPDIIFLDEPTAGVDPLARRQLWSLIRDFALHKAAILVTTHYLDEAEYCDCLAFMSASKIITQDSPRKIKADLLDQVIEIKTSGIQEAYRALESRLADWRVSVFGDSIHVFIEKSQNGFESITSALHEAGCEIESLRPIACSLEDAFIDVVQRSQPEQR
jgi:ABC-2 type transport system ATP-binding protein